MSDLLECCNCWKEVLWDKNTDLDKNWIFICSKECQDILSIWWNLKKSKDWNWDWNSIFTTLWASSHAKWEREQDDFYATDPNTIIDLVQNVDFLENCDETKPMYVWEPACWQWHLSKELKKHWFLVHSTDLVDRWFWIPNENFLNNTRIFDWHIITNPPYKYAKEFVEKAIESVTEWKKVCCFKYSIATLLAHPSGVLSPRNDR